MIRVRLQGQRKGIDIDVEINELDSDAVKEKISELQCLFSHNLIEGEETFKRKE